MKRADGASILAAALVIGLACLALSILPLPLPLPASGQAGGAEPERGRELERGVEFAKPLILPAAPAGKAPPLPSPGARVEALVASGEPHDAYLAFRLIDRCARGPQARPQIEPACRDISATQLRLRLPLLEAAARAGVPGAATAWTGEGPFGDKTALTQRPDDPLVVEWVRQAVEMIRTAAGRDDVAAITQLGWLTVHWNMSDTERLSALVNHPAEWEPHTPAPAAICQEPATCR